MIDRRKFILSSGAFASAAAFGAIPASGLRLKVGIVSDTHIQDEGSARHFEKALRYFRDCGVDPAFYNQRRRSFDEVLPWDHIDMGIKKSFLIKECQRAYENAVSPDCTQQCLACGAACFQGGICYER